MLNFKNKCIISYKRKAENKKIYSHQRELKAILHSKRANVFYLEHCRVLVKGGRVTFLTDERAEKQYWNIPIANTTSILLGTGTSITQAAVRLLSAAGVMIGFSGTGGTPLISATEVETPPSAQDDVLDEKESHSFEDEDSSITWLSPQSEYRPTEYLQGWMSFWFDDEKRLEVAQQFQNARLTYLERVWDKDRDLQAYRFFPDEQDIESALTRFTQKIKASTDTGQLLRDEAQLTKSLYKAACARVGEKHFVRERHSEDLANQFLNHGNYLAYGLAATTLWVLGIPHGFAVMHGKTRRGALVFDVADLIKDALVLPWAFICAQQEVKEQEFRQQCLQAFTQHKALEYMFDEVKKAALKYPKSC